MNPWLLAAYLSAQALDGTTTVLALSRGGYEANPLMPNHPAWSVGVKIGVSVGTVRLLRTHSRTHPTATRWIAIGAIATSATAGVWNVRQLRRGRS